MVLLPRAQHLPGATLTRFTFVAPPRSRYVPRMFEILPPTHRATGHSRAILRLTLPPRCIKVGIHCEATSDFGLNPRGIYPMTFLTVWEWLRSHDVSLPPLAKFAMAMAVIVGIPPLCRRARLPAVVGLLLCGVVLGPYVLELAGERTPIADFFAQLGRLLLIFFAGLEIDLATSTKQIAHIRSRHHVDSLAARHSRWGLVRLSARCRVVIGSLLASHTLLGAWRNPARSVQSASEKSASRVSMNPLMPAGRNQTWWIRKLNEPGGAEREWLIENRFKRAGPRNYAMLFCCKLIRPCAPNSSRPVHLNG